MRTARRIRALPQNLNAEQVIDFVFSKQAELITPWQFREEILGLAKLYEQHRPCRIMEIGTANGGTLFVHARLAPADAVLVSVDLPGGKFGGGYPAWKTPYYNSFKKSKQVLHLMRADSHARETFAKVQSVLDGKMLDYLFIDGDHTYEGVKQDYEMYSPLVRPGGIVVFHDVVAHDNFCQVDKFWNEIKTRHRHTEFINDLKQGCFGVGVLYKNGY